MSVYIPAGGWLAIKRPQFVEEAVYGTTPSSPTFTSAGPLSTWTNTSEIQNTQYRELGTRDINSLIKTGEQHSFQLTYNPVDAVLMGYGVNLPSGSGSIEKSLSFVTSQKMDNVENYIVCTGCITNEITIEIANDSPVNVTQSFRAKNISTPATTPGFTGTPTYAANTTLLPWTNQTPGSGPLTFNGTVVDVSTFSTTITNNVNEIKPNGDAVAKIVAPTLREVTFSFTTWFKDTTLIADTKTLTPRAMEYKLSTDKKLVFTDAYLNKFETSDDVGSNDFKDLAFTGVAKAVTISSY